METISLQAPTKLSQWLQLYRLYRTAFPRSERKPFMTIVKKYRQGIFDVWCICRSGKFSGMATTITHNDLVLLDYLAIMPQHRSQGIGTAALKILKSRYHDRDLLLEIESVYEDCPDRPQRLRRKAFYLNCGLEPMGVMVCLFGVPMELLSFGRKLTFPEYHRIYEASTGSWVASHITSLPYPEQE